MGMIPKDKDGVNSRKETNMERTVATLKERIRAGSAKIPAEKVIRGGMLVNVMSSEIYPRILPFIKI